MDFVGVARWPALQANIPRWWLTATVLEAPHARFARFRQPGQSVFSVLPRAEGSMGTVLDATNGHLEAGVSGYLHRIALCRAVPKLTTASPTGGLGEVETMSAVTVLGATHSHPAPLLTLVQLGQGEEVLVISFCAEGVGQQDLAEARSVGMSTGPGPCHPHPPFFPQAGS